MKVVCSVSKLVLTVFLTTLALALTPSESALGIPGQSLRMPAPVTQPLRREVVIRGEEVRSESPLWRTTVRLEVGDSFCTGTILDHDMILTAAHCVPQGSGPIKISFIRGTKHVVGIRETDSYLIHESYVENANPQRQTFKRTWDFFFGSNSGHDTTHDLAVIQFAGGLPEEFHPTEILEDFGHLRPGTEIYAIGFGQTDPSARNTPNHHLRYTKMQIDLLLEDKEVRVMDRAKQSTLCQGDSGGPGYVQLGNTFYLWGIAYAVQILDDRCAGWAYYSSLQSHGEWIERAVLSLRKRP